MHFYNILQGTQEDINRRLLKLIKKNDEKVDELSALTESVATLEDELSALTERVTALEEREE